jgi:uncharacterized protein YjbJ (UPF0337 family)
MKGKIKQKWAKLTDDDIQFIEGRQDEAAGILQKRYGIARDAAEKQWKEFCDSCSCE